MAAGTMEIACSWDILIFFVFFLVTRIIVAHQSILACSPLSRSACMASLGWVLCIDCWHAASSWCMLLMYILWVTWRLINELIYGANYCATIYFCSESAAWLVLKLLLQRGSCLLAFKQSDPWKNLKTRYVQFFRICVARVSIMYCSSWRTGQVIMGIWLNISTLPDHFVVHCCCASVWICCLSVRAQIGHCWILYGYSMTTEAGVQLLPIESCQALTF